ncbi:MAG: phage Gp19/Gp15/Gp42 family protein [Clostridiales bacterium]|nr:phage Gp19/Gp15/Gp42 family protein [Clostridiales bacterium]
MAYASTDEVATRCRRTLSDEELEICEALLEDAAVIIDSYNSNASDDAKRVVSCNMVIRVLGDSDSAQMPIGTTQGSMSALGYSQSFTIGAGSSGELYLSKLDKRLLGVGNRLTFASPWEASE